MYLGNQPALNYTSFAKQDFSTSSTTSYVLDNPVANSNELALFINFVRQEPTTSYSASGTTLTLTEATSSSDDMYAIFLGKAIQTVNPPNASVGASQIVDGSIALGKLSASGTKDATTFLRGDNTFASAGGDNTPNFWVYLNSNQSVATSTFTTVAFANELFDSANAFDTSTHKYTAPSAGKWFFGVQVRKENSRTDRNLVHFKVNNSTKLDFETGSYSNYGASIGTTIIDLNANDVVHLEFYHDRGSNQSIRGGVDGTFFYGYKLIT